MENAKWIKNIVIVFTEIERKLVDRNYKISQGGATMRVLDNFLQLFVKEYGKVTHERLIDFCVCTAYAYRHTQGWTIKQAFGPSSIKRLSNSKRGTRYYEDNWLQEARLSRAQLIALIIDKSEHPLSKYIFMSSEEATKLRLLNKEMGFDICQSSTLGWSPVSSACNHCNYVTQCQKETEKKYPELFRIRVEYGKSIQ